MKRKSYALRLPALALFLLALGVVASAQQRTFVSTSGDDANDCTRLTPCRNFAAAVAAVSAGGDVIALDSGEFGPFKIDKSVTVTAPAGVSATVTGTTASYNAITVDAASNDTVVVRGLVINSEVAYYGIRVITVGSLHVESCTIGGFWHTGISVSASSNSQLFVKDTVVRDNGFYGIKIGTSPGLTANAMIDRVRVENNVRAGFLISSYVRVTIRDSVASGSQQGIDLSEGYYGEPSSELHLEDSTVANNSQHGLRASRAGSLVSVSRSTFTRNGIAIYARNTGAIVRVSDATIVRNGQGLVALTDGSILSRQNNTVEGNTTNGSFTATFLAK